MEFDLDRIDYAILGHLQNNARMPNKELAQRVGVAPSTALTRVRYLERTGAITGYHCELNPRCIDIRLQAMIAVRLQYHSARDVAAFHDYLLELAEVVQLYHLAGANDFLIHVWVRDAEHLRELTMEALTTRPEVAHLETALIFEHSRRHSLSPT